MSENLTNKWNTVITAHNSWLDLDLKDVWRFRELIFLFVRRDFVATYKQTIFGPLWYVLQPLLTVLVYTVIFGLIARLPTDGVPMLVFYLSGIIVWNYFSSCLNRTSDTFIANATIFGKVYFPRLTVPIASVITNLISFSIQLTLFVVILLYYCLTGTHLGVNLWVLAVPVLILQLAALGLGMGIIITSLTTKYRDLAYLVSFGLQLWMYATPIVYPLSMIPKKFNWIFVLNPVAPIVETFRYAFFGGQSFQVWHLGLSLFVTVIVLLIGALLFNHTEKTFMDTI